MRKITAGLFIALDGVVEAPDQWHFPYFNDEMGAAVGGQLGAADTILLGHDTYESFAGAWPDREAGGGEDAEFAKKLGDTRKIVVSRQALQFTWRNSEQLDGDLAERLVLAVLHRDDVDRHHRVGGPRGPRGHHSEYEECERDHLPRQHRGRVRRQAHTMRENAGVTPAFPQMAAS